MNKHPLGLAVATLALAGSLQAQVILNPDDPALAGSTLVNFDSFLMGTAASYTSGNVTFQGMDGLLRVWDAYSGYDTDGQYLDNAPGADQIKFLFGTDVSAFGIRHFGADDPWNLYVYDAFNNQIGSATATPTVAAFNGGFIGWNSNAGNIAYAILQSSSGEDLVLYDSFEYAPGDGDTVTTPEPATMVLLGTGLAVVAAARRRRKHTA